MVKYLDTSGINNEVNLILKNASTFIYILSPYLKICDKIKDGLEDKDRMKIDTWIIYGKADLPPEVSDWLNRMKSIRVLYCSNLHAKCYLNESMAVITSMNMYEYSQINNEEMGIAVYKAEDPEIYDDIFKDVQRLKRKSTDVEVSVKKLTPEEIAIRDKKGFCIRCGTEIPINVARTYCNECQKIWLKYSDAAYIEKKGVCHLCGESNPSSFEKPVCKSCYNENKALFK